MLKINTLQKSEDLLELAQESPYPMAKRALEAIKNGKNEEAAQILEELLGHLNDKNSFRLYQYTRELIYRVILWKQMPENQKEGVWLTEIDKYREEIALLFYKQPELAQIFEDELESAISSAIHLAETYIKNEVILIPSRAEIFEVEFDWQSYELNETGNEQEK